MSYPNTIGGAVPISTSGNRATSGWPLHHQQQQQKTQAFEIDDERRARWSYVPLYYVCDEHDYCTNILHCVVCFFLTAATTIVTSSPLTSESQPREKISSMRRTKSPIPSPIHHMQARLVRLSTELSVLIRLRGTDPVQTKAYTWT